MPNLLDRVLIVGGSGQVGSELQRALAGGIVFAPPRAQLDVEHRDSVLSALESLRPTLVVNTSAFHNTEQCERFPERAFSVNALAVDRLAGACSLAGAAFMTFSTDYVFDGLASRPYREDDPTNPQSVYGASKVAGEQLVKRHGERFFIVRTSGVYGGKSSSAKGLSFIERIIKQAEAGEPIRVVDDITFSPSYSRDLADGVRRIIERAPFGTYHLANGGATTWYEFAREALRFLHLEADIRAVPSSDFPSIVRRPKYSALEPQALERAGLERVAPWQDALARYLSARPAG